VSSLLEDIFKWGVIKAIMGGINIAFAWAGIILTNPGWEHNDKWAVAVLVSFVVTTVEVESMKIREGRSDG
jgi:hypothetical protein